jgi:hypothetical protein
MSASLVDGALSVLSKSPLATPAAGSPGDVASVTVGGKVYAGWTSIRISRAA